MDELDDYWDLQKSMDRYGAPANFNGAAIIDADGNEIEITEEMIMGACDCLVQAWQFPCDCDSAEVFVAEVLAEEPVVDVMLVPEETTPTADSLQPET
jgi:hypothetical protein